jgi:hypothetical protein
MCWPRACCIHREGGLGDLHAVVDDAPAEAARNAPTMQFPLAANHGLHRMTAHTDGPLQRETGFYHLTGKESETHTSAYLCNTSPVTNLSELQFPH